MMVLMKIMPMLMGIGFWGVLPLVLCCLSPIIRFTAAFYTISPPPIMFHYLAHTIPLTPFHFNTVLRFPFVVWGSLF